MADEFCARSPFANAIFFSVGFPNVKANEHQVVNNDRRQPFACNLFVGFPESSAN